MKHKTSAWRVGVFAALLLLFMQTVAFAATSKMTGVRFGQGTERERIVFDVSSIPQVTSKTEDKGRRVILTFSNVTDAAGVKPIIKSEFIRRVTFQKKEKEKQIVVTIELTEAAQYEIKTLKRPNRVFITFECQYERKEESLLAPGLKLTKYTRRDGRGRLAAWLLDVDCMKYKIAPMLADGEVRGRARLSDISDDVNAMAAINASYFSPAGDIYGVLRMNGQLVGTTYFKRSALGIKKNGAAFVAPVYYQGQVTIGGVSRTISGVNCEREENALILYNPAYHASTMTNAFGREFVVRGGKVTAIKKANTPIPKDGYVISVHGTSRNAFARVRVGDTVTLTEDFGAPWLGVPTIIGAGPTLVKGGRVNVTASAEDFPADIAVGRAPRTGVALLPNRHMLLAVVDGRQVHSVGCTLEEFAELLVSFGARDAINFDGGGSSEMLAGGRILNAPSDGVERPVGSALVVLPK